MSPPCSLCLPITAIAPSSLPALPRIWRGFTGTVESQDWFYFRCVSLSKPEDRPGLPHHQSLEALADSAKTCTLCGIIEQDARAFIEHFRSLEEDVKFRFNYIRPNIHALPKEWKFWLVKRPDGGAGGLALVQSSNQRTTYVVSAIGLSCDPETPAASYLSGMRISLDAGANTSFNLPIKWLQRCKGHHPSCSPPKGPLPSRVLDLEAFSDASLIRLHEGRDDGPSDSNYAALSHCWGGAKFPDGITTKGTLEDRLKSIVVMTLPQTFQEAIWVTRKFGIRYLWIDSLCICQDDKDEWARESAAMTELYSRAQVVIAADRARESAEGFLMRSPRDYVPTMIYTNKENKLDETTSDAPSAAKSDEGMHALAFRLRRSLAILRRAWFELGSKDPEPLHTRAWALQERLLPYRIIHFTQEQMFFECNTQLVSEDGFQSPGRWNSLYPGPENPYEPMARYSMVSKVHTLWYLLLEDFTYRSLTYQSDRLTSLAGLARVIKHKLTLETGSKSVEYVGGLWSDALIEGLGWSCIAGQGKSPIPLAPPLPGSKDYIAPSWSWASKPGISAHGMTSKGCKNVAVALDWNVTPENDQNPYGELVDGWVKLRGPLIPLTLSQLPEHDEPEGFTKSIRFKSPRGILKGNYAYLDQMMGQTPELRDWCNGRELHALVLSSCDPLSGKGGAEYTSIILQRVTYHGRHDGDATYQRIGQLHMDPGSIGEDSVFVTNSDSFTEVILI